MYHHSEICAVGIDVWQVKSGSIFDNILITDDEKEADAEADVVLKKTMVSEKKMKKDADEAERKKEAEAKDEEDDSKPDDAKDKEDEVGDKPSSKDEL